MHHIVFFSGFLRVGVTFHDQKVLFSMGHGCLEFQVDPYMGFFMAKKQNHAAAAHRTLDRVILGYTQPFPI